MTPMMLALVILAATIVLFIWEPIPIAVTAILSSLAYAYTGIVPVNTIFSSYDNNTNILLAGMMVVGSSLFHTGITDVIGERMVKITGKNERNIILVTLIVSCLLSSVPLMTPMADIIGITRQVTVQAFQFGDGLSNLITPLNGTLMGGLAMAHVEFPRYFKWVINIIAGQVFVAAIVTMLLQYVGWTGL